MANLNLDRLTKELKTFTEFKLPFNLKEKDFKVTSNNEFPADAIPTVLADLIIGLKEESSLLHAAEKAVKNLIH